MTIALEQTTSPTVPSGTKNDYVPLSNVSKRLIQLMRLRRIPVSKTGVQKLLYYTYSWFLVGTANKQSLFEEEPEAWVYGPVFKTLYNNFENILRESEADIQTEVPNTVESVLSRILDVYGNLSKDDLVVLTHSEDPWKNARVNTKPLEQSSRKISQESIYEYYGNL